MAPEEAAQFSQNIDWATTLVVPIPVYEASYRQVTVDGVQGTLILSDQGDYGQQYMLIWIKGDMVYVLTGPGGADTAVRLGKFDPLDKVKPFTAEHAENAENIFRETPRSQRSLR